METSPPRGKCDDGGNPFTVALVSMPWPLCNRPSIQLGTLKAFLRQRYPSWLHVHCLHPYLHLAAGLGATLYHKISQNMWLAEAVYAPLVHPEMAERAERLMKRRLRGKGLPRFDFARVSELARRSLMTLLDDVDWRRIDLAGFSICTNQLFATLAAARALKEKAPDIKIVIGGSACFPEMLPGLRDLGTIDYLIHAEGEMPLAELCAYLSGRKEQPGPETHAVMASDVLIPESRRREQIMELDSLPVPDYDDYFHELKHVFPESFIPLLPVEFSRGCWWGKCVFCNLNRQWHGYRAKTPGRMEKEILELSSRHGCLDFAFTDNVLPPGKAGSFFKSISTLKKDFHFFVELRASGREFFTDLAQGGVRTVQVGIEALSAGLLAKMNKGESVMDNVAAMKEALQAGIVLEGNIIVDFPNATAAEIEETLAVLDFLTPFPPLATATFFLGLGSAIEQSPWEYGIRATGVHPYMRDLLPEPLVQRLPFLVRGYSRGEGGCLRQAWRPVRDKIMAWRLFHKKRQTPAVLDPPLSYRDGGDFLLVRQETPERETLHHRLRGASREIYLRCHAPASLEAIAQDFPSFSAEALYGFLNDLLARKILFHHDGAYLALAVHRMK